MATTTVPTVAGGVLGGEPQIGHRTACRHPGCGGPIELVPPMPPHLRPAWAHVLVGTWVGPSHEATPVEPVDAALGSDRGCDTCSGTGWIKQEGQIGVPGSGCTHGCPDCEVGHARLARGELLDWDASDADEQAPEPPERVQCPGLGCRAPAWRMPDGQVYCEDLQGIVPSDDDWPAPATMLSRQALQRPSSLVDAILDAATHHGVEAVRTTETYQAAERIAEALQQTLVPAPPADPSAGYRCAADRAEVMSS